MEKKILRVQLYTLFILTTLNLIYFNYRDNLPDNYYEIALQNQSINFFTYYFFSVLANFGYWCGIWVTISFVTFAALHSFVLTKNKDFKNQIVIVALLPLTLFLCYLIFPETLGEGLYFLLKENLSLLTVLSSVFIFGASFFYLVSEKKFFKTCSFLQKKAVILFNLIKNADYSAITKFDARKYFNDLKIKLGPLLGRFSGKELAPLNVSRKMKISGASSLPEVKRSLPVDPDVPSEADEISIVESDANTELPDVDVDVEAFDDSQIDDTDEDEDEEESDEESEFEEVESPFRSNHTSSRRNTHQTSQECIIEQLGNGACHLSDIAWVWYDLASEAI